MGQLTDIKRILTEDFPSENKELIEKLALNLNNFMDEVINTINGNIDFTNLTRQYKSITVTVDSNGNVIRGNKYIIDFTDTIKGINVIKCTNKDNLLPDGSPFITYSQSDKNLIVSNIKGLPANKEFTLFIELIGK